MGECKGNYKNEDDCNRCGALRFVFCVIKRLIIKETTISLKASIGITLVFTSTFNFLHGLKGNAFKRIVMFLDP